MPVRRANAGRSPCCRNADSVIFAPFVMLRALSCEVCLAVSDAPCMTFTVAYDADSKKTIHEAQADFAQ